MKVWDMQHCEHMPINLIGFGSCLSLSTAHLLFIIHRWLSSQMGEFFISLTYLGSTEVKAQSFCKLISLHLHWIKADCTMIEIVIAIK